MSAAGNAPGRHVAAALYVDLEGIRARYECLRCRTVEGPVHGVDAVSRFTAGIKADHRARCTAVGEHR